jgi:outer membrane protein OmpA-like peptidoglycan-associated protein
MRPLILFLSSVLVTGCASERIVLLPSADGHASAVVVRNSQGEQRLDQPFAENVRRSSHQRVKKTKSDLVQKLYGATLAAQPARSNRFMVFFDEGSDVVSPASLNEIELAKAEIGKRVASEIMVIGHTDRSGSAEANEVLSQRRVDAVRVLLLAAGVPEADIETASRGEREPLVPTADGVADPMNRRVEISVR